MRLDRIFLTFTTTCLSLSHAANPLQTNHVEAPAVTKTKTKTKIWSTVESSVDFVQWINPRKMTMFTTKTVTSFEPRPVFTPYPNTIVQVVVSHVRLEDRITPLNALPVGLETTNVSGTVATYAVVDVLVLPSE